MNDLSLEQWLDTLHQAHPKEIQLGLDRVRRAYHYLPSIPKDTRVISVSGTNGKGSCVAALEAMALEAGVACAVYTSPHLKLFEERLHINGQPLEESEWCASFERVESARVKANVSLTFFEFSTLAVLDLTRQHAVNLLVLEVGLGGLMDAVNIIDSDVAILTSVAVDHVDYLGDDIEYIAEQKAGIFRKGCPAVVAEPNPPNTIASTAKSCGANLYLWGRDFETHVAQTCIWRGKTTTGDEICVTDLEVPILHVNVLAAALQAWQLLYKPDVHALTQLAHVAHATSMKGRWQWVRHAKHNFLLDVAHNPAAARYLSHRLARSHASAKIHAVWGMCANKNIVGFVTELAGQIEVWHPVSVANNRRSADLATHLDALHVVNAKVSASGLNNVACILDSFENEHTHADIVLVCGSFAVVSESLDWLAAHTSSSLLAV